MIDKKNTFLWTLYDFANSIVVIVFTFYFSQWLVVDKGVSDLTYNLLFVGATVLLIATTPVLGAFADTAQNRLGFIRLGTFFMFVFLLAGSFAAATNAFGPHSVGISCWAFLIANYFYQFSLTFYNALLPTLSDTKHQATVSGLGQSANWIGQITGLVVTIPFALGSWHFLSGTERTQPLIPATFLFLVFSIPMLFWFTEKGPKQKISWNFKAEYRGYWNNLKTLLMFPGVAFFLGGYFFFNDAILTAEQNFSIYLQQIFKVSDSTKSLVLLSILATAACGAYIIGKVADRIGLKKTLVIILVCWVILFPSFALAPNFTVFAALSGVMGFFYGATWTVTRAVMSSLVPEHFVSKAFSYYTLAERFATFLGPVAWGIITTTMVQYGGLRYKVAIAMLGLFTFVGLLLIRKIPDTSSAVIYNS